MLQKKIHSLFTALQRYSRPAVAFSGGVDSTVLLRAVQKTHAPESVLAITAFSPSFPNEEKQQVTQLADFLHVSHHFLATDEIFDPDYLKNDKNRCYYCKRRIFYHMMNFASANNCDVLLEGSNADDQNLWRPGKKALEEYGIPSPLADAGLKKAEIRQIAKMWELPVSEKPSTPCLASRFAYGIPLTDENFRRVEAAENFLRKLLENHLKTLPNMLPCPFRVRVHEGNLARIELPPEWFYFLTDPKITAKITENFKKLGFHFITLDMEGFRSGCYDAL
ncbi:MAG: ATP-dependent sacrificial sulfur transferase LarE [Planctomycetia bacterium]|nr:ATP-dependent sacrificial sulfur transferase LarE [Planctomycetia bacterium]